MFNTQRDNYTILKRSSQEKTLDAVSYQAEVQNIIILYLCQFTELSVRKPSKQARITTQFQKVKTIRIGDEIIDFQKVVKKRCEIIEHIMLKQNVKRETIKKRLQAIKRREAYHLLEDFLFMFGIVIVGGKDERDGLVGYVKIVNIFDSSVMCEGQPLRELGSKISKHINSFVVGDNSTFLNSCFKFF
ncbi:hypothetical protein EIN_097360 [Entamoeba invadens IP1]|uniref:Uncharacterized protein n=1 Tax=Entamoeba invadens IP1 TaxID=370355 RepID=A0A0A1U0N5_ENTIV|nr:hypothetical protein EIN_097360 [Entamoeba invadens IP1]ELP87459.1 hypothetical protein EIN_097360 [Entamoeba invadens IP1]|eukprot:XP_004254230.1 hypothetical protein EIN_097360 [Entamoeba invadens IP1]